jgi:transposase
MVTARLNSRIAKLAQTGMTYRQVAAIVGLGDTATRHRIARMRKAGTIPPAIECRARYADKVAATVMK